MLYICILSNKLDLNQAIRVSHIIMENLENIVRKFCEDNARADRIIFQRHMTKQKTLKAEMGERKLDFSLG